jgi:hypothetical protein
MDSADIIDDLTQRTAYFISWPAADILDIRHEAAYYPPSPGSTSSEVSADFS